MLQKKTKSGIETEEILCSRNRTAIKPQDKTRLITQCDVIICPQTSSKTLKVRDGAVLKVQSNCI